MTNNSPAAPGASGHATAANGSLHGLEVYLQKRMLRILLLGMISGFPWVLIGSALTLWLQEEGLSRSTIGWASLIFGVYAINFWWAPLIDRIRIPWLTEKVGHRKSWILTLQLIIFVSLLAWSFVNPTDNLALVIGIGLIIAISSASQDITIDALRIEQVHESDTASMAAGAAMAVVGWWTGYKLGGAFALFAADYFQQAGNPAYWQQTFLVLTGLMLIMNLLLLLIPEESAKAREALQAQDQNAVAGRLGADGPLTRIVSWITATILAPLTSFFRKNGVAIGIAILSFILLFKIGEAFMGKMSLVFYKELGFSKRDIAIFSKSFGWITTIVFTLLGGWFAIRAGVVKALFLAGIAMAATNLMFTLLAEVGPNNYLFATAVIIDDIAAAFATVAFVTFISLLIDRTYTATQYALLASIGTAGRTFLAASSGELVDWLEGDWGIFFIITALMVIPSLIILWFIRNRLKLQQA